MMATDTPRMAQKVTNLPLIAVLHRGVEIREDVGGVLAHSAEDHDLIMTLLLALIQPRPGASTDRPFASAASASWVS
jgi:hypothetical protein